MKPVFGAMLGGLGGYWLRPSVPLLGQLPFETVITRGASLRGLDVLLKGIAEQSFNYLVAGVALGFFVGLLVGQMGSAPRREGP